MLGTDKTLKDLDLSENKFLKTYSFSMNIIHGDIFRFLRILMEA